jgi:hypothetical protein
VEGIVCELWMGECNLLLLTRCRRGGGLGGVGGFEGEVVRGEFEGGGVEVSGDDVEGADFDLLIGEGELGVLRAEDDFGLAIERGEFCLVIEAGEDFEVVEGEENELQSVVGTENGENTAAA